MPLHPVLVDNAVDRVDFVRPSLGHGVGAFAIGDEQGILIPLTSGGSSMCVDDDVSTFRSGLKSVRVVVGRGASSGKRKSWRDRETRASGSGFVTVVGDGDSQGKHLRGISAPEKHREVVLI